VSELELSEYNGGMRWLFTIQLQDIASEARDASGSNCEYKAVATALGPRARRIR